MTTKAEKATKAAGAANAPVRTPQSTPERILLFRNLNAITKTLADLNASVRHFNGAIKKLTDRDLLPLGLTDEILRGICLNDPAAIIQALEATTDSGDTRTARRLSANALADEVREVKTILADLADTMNSRRLTDGLRLHDHERANYLKAVDGKAGFSRSDVEAYFSVYADTPEQIEYIAEARRVFDTLAEFDRKTRILGRGKVRGVGDAETGAIPEIIAVYDGKITLDLAAVSDLVFAGAEERAKRMKFDDRYIIAKPER